MQTENCGQNRGFPILGGLGAILPHFYASSFAYRLGRQSVLPPICRVTSGKPRHQGCVVDTCGRARHQRYTAGVALNRWCPRQTAGVASDPWCPRQTVGVGVGSLVSATDSWCPCQTAGVASDRWCPPSDRRSSTRERISTRAASLRSFVPVLGLEVLTLIHCQTKLIEPVRRGTGSSQR